MEFLDLCAFSRFFYVESKGGFQDSGPDLKGISMVLPLRVTTPCDSYAWNYREIATLCALSKSKDQFFEICEQIHSCRQLSLGSANLSERLWPFESIFF